MKTACERELSEFILVARGTLETMLQVRHANHGAVRDADMVFIAAGMGGGTGTGGTPVVAQVAQDMKALTVGVVTLPFNFEAKRRRKVASGGIQELRNRVDTLIVVPNENLFSIINRRTPMTEAFGYADDVTLLSPTRQGLQLLLDICEEFASSHSMLFSTDPVPAKSKTKCLFFSHSRSSEDIKNVKLQANTSN